VLTAPDLAKRIGVDPKRFRAWLRAEAAAGHPLLASHEHNQRWEFVQREAKQLVREFRSGVRTLRARTSIRTVQRGGVSAGEVRANHQTSPGRRTLQLDGSLTLRDKQGRLLALSEEQGHRISADWMGNTVLTLEDLLRPGMRAVAVGINPAPISVACGHYYQGRSGRRILARLRQANLIEETDDEFEDDAAFAAGLGFTDVIKRPTMGAKELQRAEFEYGRELLLKNVELYRPKLLVFTFKRAAQAVFGRFQGNGFVPGLRLGQSEVYVMPGPMENHVTARPTLARLAERVRRR